MSTQNLVLCEASDDTAWDAFVDQSPQGTIFSKTAFLRSLGAPFRRWLVQREDRTLAQWALIEDGPGRAIRYPYTPYQGILLAPAQQRLARQRVLDEFRLTDFLIKELTTRYTVLNSAMCWTFEDLRPFLWHHHGMPGQPRFLVALRYTAVLQLQTLDPSRPTVAWRACRRQELRKAAQIVTSESDDVDEFLRIYQRTFVRQGLTLPESQADLVRRITHSALAGGYGRLSACKVCKETAAMSLFLYDRKRAYHLFAANEPEHRGTGAATRLMLDNILEARHRGLFELDFVGVNSPTRGDFKISFNPQLKSYFELTYEPAHAPP